MRANHSNIEHYIPQRKPFVMISRLVAMDTNFSQTELDIFDDNVLLDNDTLSESGLIENMAQTAAAYMGFRMLEAKQEVPIGFIAALKNLEIFALPSIGSTIKTDITIVNQVFDFSIVDAKVECHMIVIAKAQLRIFVKK